MKRCTIHGKAEPGSFYGYGRSNGKLIMVVELDSGRTEKVAPEHVNFDGKRPLNNLPLFLNSEQAKTCSAER